MKILKLLQNTIITTFLLINLFQSANAAQDFAKIELQAQLANASYLDANDLKIWLKKNRQVLVHQDTITDSKVSYFLSLSEEGVQTISIRGTANLENAILDLDVALEPDPQLNIILHRGFGSAAKAVYDDVKPYLDSNAKIQTTGHSLGGAIAVILAMYLQQENYSLTQVITFGQPKVTNVAGSKKFAALPLIRVVTPKDIVPLVPPISPLQIKDLDIFWHMGKEIILMGNKQYAQTSGLKSMLRATKFTSSIPNEENLEAHKMTTYLGLINGLLNTAKEIPYKTKFGLFGYSLN